MKLIDLMLYKSTKPAQPQSFSKHLHSHLIDPPESLKGLQISLSKTLEIVATLVTAVADTANKRVQKSKKFKNISEALNPSECKNSPLTVSSTASA